MAEYIEREAVVKKIREWFWSAPGVHPKLDRDTAEEIMFAIPAADVVEAVRCRDCASCEWKSERSTYGWCKEYCVSVMQDEFCSCGVKREAEHG